MFARPHQVEPLVRPAAAAAAAAAVGGVGSAAAGPPPPPGISGTGRQSGTYHRKDRQGLHFGFV